jgi:Tfp pilus assembly protein PilX
MRPNARVLPRRERGMTLVVVLIMLVMITLFVVSMVRLTSTTTIVVGNMQAQKVVETEAQQAVEIAVNQFNFFNDALNGTNAWASSATSITAATLWSTYAPSGAGTTAPTTQSTVTVYRPQCIYAAPASGYSALSNVSPQDSTWDVKVTAVDSVTGATTEVHQGLKMRLPAGSC